MQRIEKKQNINLCAYLWISICGNLREKRTFEEVEEVEKGARRRTQGKKSYLSGSPPGRGGGGFKRLQINNLCQRKKFPFML
jgi:hypothetical protein